MKSSMRTDDVKIDPSQALNEAAIGDLAHKSGQPIEFVRRVYEEEFARLAASARVSDYLVLFAMKRTRERLAGSSQREASDPHYPSREAMVATCSTHPAGIQRSGADSPEHCGKDAEVSAGE
jgi:hypothetical protein